MEQECGDAGSHCQQQSCVKFFFPASVSAKVHELQHDFTQSFFEDKLCLRRSRQSPLTHTAQPLPLVPSKTDKNFTHGDRKQATAIYKQTGPTS